MPGLHITTFWYENQARDASKTPQDAPKMPTRRPKRPPRPPKAPKTLPGRPKSPPRRLQDAPRTAPKRLQDDSLPPKTSSDAPGAFQSSILKPLDLDFGAPGRGFWTAFVGQFSATKTPKVKQNVVISRPRARCGRCRRH